jgi:hypothetical protein
MEVTPLAPPSVQLVPAKEYSGAPIGTSYDVRAYAGTLCLLNDTLSRHRHTHYNSANKNCITFTQNPSLTFFRS